jgi:hypothetical protein
MNYESKKTINFAAFWNENKTDVQNNSVVNACFPKKKFDNNYSLIKNFKKYD